MSRAEDIFHKLVYFGEEALDDFIMNMQSEELFLDFKLSLTLNKQGNYLSSNDRKNLAKAISGFGNSEGGVLIWGVECYRDVEIGDVAKTKIKVKNIHRFLSWIENAISGCTIPSHNKIRNHIISADENGDGFLATYIPKSDLAPLMTTIGNNIYIRSGSNNVPAPYAVIAGMFGRRPQPNIDFFITDTNVSVIDTIDGFMQTIKEDIKPKYVKIDFSINGKNESNVIAREMYLSCTSNMQRNEHNKVRYSNYSHLEQINGAEGQLNLITKSDFRIPPRGTVRMSSVSIILSEDIDDDFMLEGVIGADSTSPKDFRIFAPKNKMRSFVAKAMKMKESESEALADEFFNNFLIKV